MIRVKTWGVLLLLAALAWARPGFGFPADKKPRLVEMLMGAGKTVNLNGRYWTSDLGVLVFHNQKVYVLTGDTMGLGIFSPNALATSSDLDAHDGFSLRWSTLLDGNPKMFFPRIEPDSTVPAGAISLNGVLYVFMMDVTHWKDIPDPETRARPLLIKSSNNGESFSQVWLGMEDDKFINIAPVLGEHPTDPGHQVVYLFGSGKYRDAPVCLAYAEPGDIEFPNRHLYFKGLQDNLPQWTFSQNEAVPVVRGVKVGELSAVWNEYLQKYLLAFFDFGAQPYGLTLRAAAKPWGPWPEGKLVFDGTAKHDWYELGWGGPYGGYLLRELNCDAGRTVYFTLSLWTPYNIFLMELDLGRLFGKGTTRPR
jgi:hypothetical protein